MMKKSFYLIVILFILFIFSPAMLMAVDRTNYDRALEKYKNKENEEALSLFEKFTAEYPNSVKADDANWYIGRLYIRLERIDEAEQFFKNVLSDETSNRFEEASYDLGKILYSRKLYTDVIDLLSFIDSVDVLNAYHLKGKELSARAWKRLAYREKLNYNEQQSKELYNTSLSIYEELEALIVDESDLSRIRFAMAKIYSDLTDLSYDSDSYNEYLNKNLEYVKMALPSISDFYRARAEKMLIDLESSKKVGFDGRLTAFTGADNLSANTFGADIYTRGSFDFPLRNRNSLSLDLSFKHDSFDFVSSNFDKTKTGDARFVQYTNKVSADLSWKSGTRRNVYNKLKLFSDLLFAEDTKDDYTSAGVSDLGSIRFNKLWRFSWDSQFEWRIYPNYLVGGRKLDYIKGSLDPSIKLYAYDWLDISLIYGFDIKKYLDSKYDTIAGASKLNKMYMYNSGELLFDFKIGKVYSPALSYKFKYLKTFNYDYWVSGLPANRFIEGYYDNISHSITFDNTFTFNDRFKVFLDSELILTSFLNYPARDDTKTFTDKLRSDTAVKLDLGANYLFWISPKGTEFEARVSGWWDYKVSNMTYNTTFVTNYTFAGLMLGMSVKMP